MSDAPEPFSAPQEAVDVPSDDREVPPPRRMYMTEPGWQISVKSGYDKEFCYMMMPGQDFYHRLLDGEVYVHRHEEKLCLFCAVRRGLLVAEPKRLREAVVPLPADAESIPFDLGRLETERR